MIKKMNRLNRPKNWKKSSENYGKNSRRTLMRNKKKDSATKVPEEKEVVE